MKKHSSPLNEKLYDDIVTKEDHQIQFAVPCGCVKNGLLSLKFEYSDACEPGAYGDDRILAIGFAEILFTKVTN